jgi:tetratricopeptide (TPR) repeat protein
MQKSTFFISASLLIFFSCSSKIYDTADRFYEEKQYSQALTSYQQALANPDSDNATKEIIRLKIAKSFYASGDKIRALEALRSIGSLYKPYVCEWLNLKMNLLNALSKYEKGNEPAQILEILSSNECKTDENEVDLFFQGLRGIYNTNIIKTGDRFFILGNLKRDSGDLFAALKYYKRALLANPEDIDFLKASVDAFKETTDKIEARYDRKQLDNYFSKDFPRFFNFLSELYCKNQVLRENFMPKSSPRAFFLLATWKFTDARLAKPAAIFSSFEFQNEKTLIETIVAGDDLKIFRIENGEEKANYIVFSPAQKILGFSQKADQSYFF